MISEMLGMMGIGVAVAASSRTNDGRLDFSKMQDALANDLKVVAAEARVAAAKKRLHAISIKSAGCWIRTIRHRLQTS